MKESRQCNHLNMGSRSAVDTMFLLMALPEGHVFGSVGYHGHTANINFTKLPLKYMLTKIGEEIKKILTNNCTLS